MSEQKLVPELRFPEFEGEWEVKKGSLLFKSRRERGDESLPIYSVTQGNGLVPRDSLDRKMEADAASEQNLKVCPNDIVYNMMRMWQGAIGLANTECMVSPAYIVLKATNLAAPNFFNYMFKRSRPLYDLWAYSYGLTNDRLRLYYKDFARIPFPVPKPNEQQKIADFLSSVDAKLAKLGRKKALLEDYKRGLMQQIFSQKLRFKQDDGSEFPEWEYFELGEILEYEQPTKYLVNSTEYDDSYPVPVLTAGKTFILGYTNETNGIYEPMNEVIIFDDFTTASKFVDFRFKAKSSAMKILKPKDKHTSLRVIYEFMQLLKFPIGEHKRYWISEFQYFEIPTPCFAEQQKIADFLSSFDQKIDVVAKQIEQLDAFKKGLLKKLFV